MNNAFSLGFACITCYLFVQLLSESDDQSVILVYPTRFLVEFFLCLQWPILQYKMQKIYFMTK